MENRQPTYPGRVKLTPVPGQENIYDMERADEPTVEGTPLNKSTLLQDATCAILDIPDTSVPNDAFVKLALGIGKYGYVIHVQYPDGSPAVGFTLTGLNAPDGTAVVTNENGEAVGVSSEQIVTVGVESPYIDVQNVSPFSVQSTGILTNYVVTVSFYDGNDGIIINSSGNYKISDRVITMDLTAVGGGGGGGGGTYQNYGGGGGGGGGQTVSVNGIQADGKRTLSVTIGAGGSGGVDSGTAGGGTSISSNGQSLVSAVGGQPGTIGMSTPGPAVDNGGAGYGNGGSPANPTAGSSTAYKFDDPTCGLAGGGGGGLGTSFLASPPAGGNPYGGSGGGGNSSGKFVAPTAGTGPGGGGGGGYAGGSGGNPGAAGANGAGYLRFHYPASAGAE